MKHAAGGEQLLQNPATAPPGDISKTNRAQRKCFLITHNQSAGFLRHFISEETAQHTFPFLAPTPGPFLVCCPRGVRKHRGTVDADVVKVRLLQEVLLALEKKDKSSEHHQIRSSEIRQGDVRRRITHRRHLLLLPALAWLGFGLFGLGFFLHILHGLAFLADAGSWETQSPK